MTHRSTGLDYSSSDFAELIKTAGPAVKKANPNLTVIVGATSSTDTDWYQEFYRTPGIIGTYDALGIHPYQSPGDATPETYDPKWAKYYMRNIPAMDSLMDTVGDPADMWATEFGWTSHDNSTYGGTSNTPNYAKGVTEQQQADYLLRSMPILLSSPRLKAAFWYNAWNTQLGDAMQDNFGVLTVNFTRKPLWYALRCATTTICGTSTSEQSESRPGDDQPTTTTVEPTAKVWVRATKKRSKLRVNVNPNVGEGHWKFVVKRLKSDGTWRKLPTVYRTWGIYEVREINLRRGTYKVRVRAKYGYGSTTSERVRLRT